MIRTNYHTHCHLDDGTGSLESYVTEAAAKSFTALGFSCHTPQETNDDWHLRNEDLEPYLDEVDRLADAYKDTIEIYSGLEFDYLDDTKELAGSQYRDRIAYSIASVHMFRDEDSGTYLSFDGPQDDLEALLKGTFRGSGKQMATYYYRCLNELMERHSFDILGHFDLIKKRNIGNKFFNSEERWYRDLVLGALDTAAEQQVRIEVNTGGMSRGAIDEPYPSVWILSHCRERNIPMVLSADAHAPGDIDFWFDQALQHLREAGYRELDMLIGGTWVGMEI